MKKLAFVLLLLISWVNLTAQDAFQKELFSTDVVLKYRVAIGLSDQQVGNVKTIYNDHITEFNSIKWDLDAELVALNKTLASSKVDEASSMAQMEKVMQLEEKLKRIRLRMLIKIKNELSASQQEKLKGLRTEEDMKNLTVITPINDGQRVMLKIGGDQPTDNQPLFVIKDKKGEQVIHSGSIKDLDRDKIESIQVYKGEKAKELFGEKGKNGVIVIQLKR